MSKTYDTYFIKPRPLAPDETESSVPKIKIFLQKYFVLNLTGIDHWHYLKHFLCSGQNSSTPSSGVKIEFSPKNLNFSTSFDCSSSGRGLCMVVIYTKMFPVKFGVDLLLFCKNRTTAVFCYDPKYVKFQHISTYTYTWPKSESWESWLYLCFG